MLYNSSHVKLKSKRFSFELEQFTKQNHIFAIEYILSIKHKYRWLWIIYYQFWTSDFIAVGTKIKMSEKRCKEIFDEVYQNCDDLLLYKIL